MLSLFCNIYVGMWYRHTADAEFTIAAAWVRDYDAFVVAPVGNICSCYIWGCVRHVYVSIIAWTYDY